MSLSLSLSSADWLALLGHFMALSLLAIGGAITTVPDMHRYLVQEQHWLLDSQFSASIALAQAAPGPNVLFVALLGWQIGLNAGGGLAAGWPGALSAALGMTLSMLGILLPSTTLTFAVTRWAHQNRTALSKSRPVRWRLGSVFADSDESCSFLINTVMFVHAGCGST